MAASLPKKRPRVPAPPSSDSNSETDAAPASKRYKKKGNAAKFVDVYGLQAKPQVDITKTSPIRISDIQALLLWVLADGAMPSWAFVKHKPLLQRVTLVAIPGIDAACFSANADLLPNMHKLLGSPINVFSKSHHCHSMEAVQALFSVPLDKKRRRDEAAAGVADTEAAASLVAQDSNGIFEKEIQAHPDYPIETYVMDLKQRKAHGFRVLHDENTAAAVPLPLGFICTTTMGAYLSKDASATTSTVALSTTVPRWSSAAGCSSSGVAAAVASPLEDHNASLENPGLYLSCLQTTHVDGMEYVREAQETSRDNSNGSNSSRNECSDQSGSGGGNTNGSDNPPEGNNSLHQNMVALDCEMCYCGADNLEVTRLSLVDSRGEVLLDELVVPDLPITDYNTRFSGITAKMMADATLSLSAARAALFQYLGPQTILVGHALENDLEKLRVVHDRIIDTGNLYPHPRGPPYKQGLKFLMQRYLNRAIQGGQHDSVEDARAALQLAALKFRHGPGWGCGTVWGGRAERLMNVLSEAGCRATLVDRAQSLKQHTTGTADAVKVDTDAKAAVAAQRASCRPAAGFVWTQLTSLTAFHERRARDRTPKGGLIRTALEAAPRIGHAATTQTVSADKKVHPAAAMLQQDRAVTSIPSSRNNQGKMSQTAELSTESQLSTNDDSSQHPLAQKLTQHLRNPQLQQSPATAGDQPASISSASATGAEANILAELDRLVGEMHAAIPANTLLLVYTVQGDTAECRRQQQQKWRRQQDPPLDGQPAWDANGEEAVFKAVSARVSRALCFVTVKAS